MRSKQLPIIEEAPLIVVGLTMAAAAMLGAAAIAGTTRVFLRLTGLDRPAPAH
jgi:hypothetical protein